MYAGLRQHMSGKPPRCATVLLEVMVLEEGIERMQKKKQIR